MRSFSLFTIFLLVILVGLLLFFPYLIRYNARTQTVKLTHTAVIEKLQEIEELTTAEMTIQKIVKGKKDLIDIFPTRKWDDVVSSFLFKDDIVMSVEAKVVAGIKVGPVISSGITVNDDNSVSLILPQATILHVVLTDKTQTILRERGVFVKGDPTLETAIRNALLEQVKKEALSGGILDVANQKARSVLRSLLEASGIRVREIRTQQNLPHPIQ